MQLEKIENLLYEKFHRKDKFRLPEGVGILTASNDYMFPGLQFLYYSISFSHVADICVVDCGMTEIQRAWCEEKGMKVETLDSEDMLFKKDERESHIWNKGIYFEKSPFQKTLWIDSDCVVCDNLGIYFEFLEKGPVFTEDHFAPKILMPNKDSLYIELPIEPYERSKVYLNSGVICLDKIRDKGLIESWRDCVKRASEDKDIKEAIAWFDQGALMWAVEKNGLTHRIRRERAMNYPAIKAGGHWGEAQRNVVGFLESLGDDSCVVKHFMSHPKPWHNWNRGVLNLDFEESFASKVKMFVLGHNQKILDQVPDRPYFEKINLNELSLGSFQTNQLAESRIFLSPSMHRIENEYIGFGTARWNEKYAYLGTTKLEELHAIKLLLKPTNVIVAQRTDNTNGPLGDLDPVNWRTHFEVSHKGIKHYLDELARVSGINNLNPSFWANNFICHRSVFKEFLTHWLDIFYHFYSKYGFNYRFEALDPTRAAAFVMEAITINYFSSRTDLRIIEATRRDSAYKIL